MTPGKRKAPIAGEFVLFRSSSNTVFGCIYLGYSLGIVGRLNGNAQRVKSLMAEGYDNHKQRFGNNPDRVIVTERRNGNYRISSIDSENHNQYFRAV